MSEIGRYNSGLSRAISRYNRMLSNAQKAISTAGEAIPQAYRDVVDIYSKGGSYGAGARGRIKQQQKASTAGGLADLVSTGMSSGTLAEGVRSRYSHQASQAIQEVEDVRYERLGTALAAVGQAQQARQTGLASAYLSASSLVGSFQEPSVSQFSSPEALANTAGMYQLASQKAADKAASERQQASFENEKALAKQEAKNASSQSNSSLSNLLRYITL
jgi:hypothetical protein